MKGKLAMKENKGGNVLERFLEGKTVVEIEGCEYLAPAKGREKEFPRVVSRKFMPYRKTVAHGGKF